MGLLVYLCVFLFLEGTARIGYKIFINPPKDETWFAYSPDLMWELKPNFIGNVGHAKRKFDSQGFLSVDTLQRNDSKKKVIFIGDSNTFGLHVSAESTFVEILDSLLPEISMINLGVPGYTSYQGCQMLIKHGLKLNPDILVVSFNFNDRRYVINSEYTDNAITFQQEYERQLRMRKIKFLENIYLYRSMRFLFRKAGIIKSYQFNINEVKINNFYPRVTPENYRKNLVRITELAKDKNIHVIFMLLKDNPIQTEHLTKGIKYLNNSQYDQAIENLKLAIRHPNWFSDLARKYLAIAYEKQGLLEESEKILTTTAVISLHGAYPIYLDTEYNQIMMQVAENDNVKIIDAGRVLDQNNSYVDFCHPDIKGHQKIAHLLYDSLVEILKYKPEHSEIEPQTDTF